MTDYSETTSGDLSGDRNNPTDVALTLGDNMITASQSSADLDYVTVTIPAGHRLAQIVVIAYSDPDVAFIAVQAGGTFTEDPNSASAANILGGAHYGQAHIGTDILDNMGNAVGFIGFTPPLEAGQFTFWLNQTADESTVTLNFVIVAAGPTNGDDSLVGGAGADTIAALGGDDTVRGAGGNDSLSGDAGSDQLFGDAGDDTLVGGDDGDTLNGGAGNDQLFSGQGDDRADGGDNHDLIRTGGGKDTLIGGNGNDTLGASNGGDLLRGEAGADLMLGSNGNDRLFGGAAADTLLGGNGRDTLSGEAGADRLVGGAQIDTASYATAGAAVQVRLWNGDGTAGDALGDVLIEIENIEGSAFNDSLAGDAGDNRIVGNDGADIIQGLGGADQIIGGGGADNSTGGAGDDIFLFFKGHGADTINDFVAGAASDDAVRLFGFGATLDSFAEVMAATTQVGADAVIDLGAGDTITLKNVAAASLHADDFIFG